MVFDCTYHSLVAAALLLLSLAPQHVKSSTITSSSGAAPTASIPSTCEFRTINYITDSLPQLCFKSSWSADGISSTKSIPTEGGTATLIAQATEPTENCENYNPGQDTIPSVTVNINISVDSPTDRSGSITSEDLEPSELNDASFLSFEEWKKQALEKAGQEDANIGGRKSNTGENRRRDSEHLNNNLDTVGEEGEIELDFGAFRGDGKSQEASQTAEAKGSETREENNDPAKGKRRQDHYRSKDAGKTCKERFSYASFDAGATVLKTHAGAKNSKAVLVENKDTYMLSQCSTENKFIIVELSEDIWIDTVVLANYEFFSSMVRQFRISVSDRYPVKMEKWKDIGTYEARNSREIQAFLVENPHIWARYLRIEFVNHYGNEYYCPLSLVRVHGTRMLESWKESEAIGEDEDLENEDVGAEEQFVPDAVADVVQEEERLNAELREAAKSVVRNAHAVAAEDARSAEVERLANATTPWIKSAFLFSNIPEVVGEDEVCLLAEAPIQPVPASAATSTPKSTASEHPSTMDGATTMVPTTQGTSTDVQTNTHVTTENATMAVTSTVTSTLSNTTASSVSTTSVSSSTFSPPPVSAAASKTQNTTVPHKNKTTSTSSAASSLPTIQESFFKAVSRRLQLLETNSTLSLKYIEEQSKILREAFSKVEKKQLQKSSSFLDTLNNTVLAELRGFRQQYDEIWQSTVISLESQREESRKEIFAISARLNILADEVVFQKRMSIVQSVLVLLCLGLVIFSRVSASGQFDFPLHSRMRNLSTDTSFQSGPETPAYRRMGSERHEQSWSGHARHQSNESAISKSMNRDGSPPTPISADSRSEHNFTPPPGPEDVTPEIGGDIQASRPEYLEPSVQRPRSSSTISQELGNGVSSTPTSPPRKRKKRKGSLRQQQSPAPSGAAESRNVSRDSTPHRNQVNIIVSPSSGLQSPPEAGNGPGTASFNITRKPLPALPKNGG
ncbi:uncharacterized protein BP5553_07004 [Venustampulla echinocandica]|uniref:SUN domain-containing protein n=1 Tax=Venustampulla echinocandica TaxID=2656787 RepID=A0A370TI92_9HELO|nr:uncharacterized protein BP5553_07004 [Venustampulla echinocandica]RDL35073.1 hypothetical protein BP5553_07004 [Venustampulla echinocandica]